MGILTRGLHKWQAMTTEEKVEKVLNIVCGWGLGTVCGGIGNTFSSGRGKPTQIAAVIGMSGIGMMAGDIASKALMEGVAKPCIELGRAVKEKASEAAKKEEKDDGEHPYTRL